MGRNKGSKNGKRILIKKYCLICNKIFYVKPYKKKIAKFCSNKCRGISLKEKHLSPKTEFKKGRISTCGFKKRHKPWNKGKKLLQFQGKNSCHWTGGIIKDAVGYIFIYKPKHPFCDAHKYIRRSRLVVEKMIGRYLKPKEKIHHRNSIKDDDRPENLMAFINQSAHIRFHYNPNNVKPSEIIFDGRAL